MSVSHAAAIARSTVEVAQSAERLLEVGFQQVGDLALTLAALIDGGAQLVHALRREPAPVRPDRTGEALATSSSSPATARASSSPRTTLQVLRPRVGAPPTVVRTEWSSRILAVPDRVPDPIRQVADRALMQQQQVEVAADRQLAAAVPTDRDERGMPPVSPGRSRTGPAAIRR